MANELVSSSPARIVLPALFAPDPAAANRTLEFFTANIRNPHTRRAYISVAREFAAWCELQGVMYLRNTQPVHVAAYIEGLQHRLSVP